MKSEPTVFDKLSDSKAQLVAYAARVPNPNKTYKTTRGLVKLLWVKIIQSV